MGIWIQYLDISSIVISHDMGYDVTIYRDMSCDITLHHLKTQGNYTFNENPTPRCGLHLSFSVLSLPSSWLVLRLAFFVTLLLSVSWIYCRTDRTRKQQPCPLRTQPAPLEHDCFCFIFHFVSFCFLSFPVCFPS